MAPAKKRKKEIDLLAEAIDRRTEFDRESHQHDYEQREKLLEEIKKRNELLQKILDKL